VKGPTPPKNSTSIILVTLSLVAVAVVIWRISGVFVVAFGGVVLASALRSLADPFAEATHLSLRWSIVVVVVALLMFAALTVWLLGPQATTQFSELQQQLPQATEKFITWLQQSEIGRAIVKSGRNAAADSKLVSNLGVAASVALGAASTTVLIFFLAVYFAADARLYRDGLLRLLPPLVRPRVRRALDDAGDALRRWLLAQSIAMVTVGLLAGLSLGVVGVPLALALGIVAGLLEFIPVVGPILSSVPGVLLAFAKGPEMAIYAALTYLGVHIIESNVIVPLAQRWTMRFPPVVGLLSILACGLLFGVMGVVFATPIGVVVMALVKHLYVEDTLENHHPSSA